MQNQRLPGRNGFIWWMGRVVQRDDPEQLGRVKVRCLGWHTDNVEQLPTASLPWAVVVYEPSPNPQINPPRIGDWVFGFFQDGEAAQVPYVLGVIPTKGAGGWADDLGDEGPEPLANRPVSVSTVVPSDGTAPAEITPEDNVPLTSAGTPGASTGTPSAGQAVADSARKTGLTAPDGSTFDEPASSYAAVYPYNKAIVSESGHALELDDSPGAARINIRHHTGTGIEMQPNADMIQKTINNAHIFTDGNSFKHVAGGETVNYGADLKIMTGGGVGVDLKVDGGGGINIVVTGGDVTIDTTGNVTTKTSGNVTHECGGNYTIKAGGNVDIDGARIDLN